MIESARTTARYVRDRAITSATRPSEVGRLAAGVAATALVVQALFAARLVDVDADVRGWLASLAWPHQVAVDLRSFASLASYYGALLVVVAVAVARRRGAPGPEILRLAAGLGLALVVAQGAKLVCWRMRPTSPVDGPQLDSFPSGHTVSIALCLAAALHLLGLRARGDHRWWYAAALAGGVTTIAVAFVRVYLQRHWLTDVSASLLIAIVFWGTASPARVPRPWVALAAALGLLALTGVHTVLPTPPVAPR